MAGFGKGYNAAGGLGGILLAVIGFLIALPFLVIDMIVATLTMSMGMMMLPPSVISLPIKVMFFVLIDGWNLLIGSLIRSYG